MEFDKEDKVEHLTEGIKHESAGGFLFFEDKKTHELSVALLSKADGGYLIPKGHIKKGEKAEDAAIREIKEELNLKETPKILSFLKVHSYTFTLEGSSATHYKDVYLYVFQLDKKAKISPQISEGFRIAEWVPFEEAVERISFDKEGLIKARESFYYSKENSPDIFASN